MNATLALGQVDVPILGGDGTSVERARQQFLEACAGYDAKLLRSLRAGPYEMAQKLGNTQALVQAGTSEAKKLVESTKKVGGPVEF